MAKQEQPKPNAKDKPVKPAPAAPKTLVATLSIEDMPQILASMRAELARLLRAEADRHWRGSEQTVVDIAVRQSLERVARCFEAGIITEDDVKIDG